MLVVACRSTTAAEKMSPAPLKSTLEQMAVSSSFWGFTNVQIAELSSVRRRLCSVSCVQGRPDCSLLTASGCVGALSSRSPPLQLLKIIYSLLLERKGSF